MACRMNDPVLFMEHKGLYRQGYAATKEPDIDYIIPFGKGRLVSKGKYLTLVTWGAMVQKSSEAVQELKLEEDIVEIIDLRTLNPIDFEILDTSIKKTGKVLIVHEDNLTNGPGAEIAAIIINRYFEYLEGPIRRIAAKDSPIPFNWIIEEKILPQTKDILYAIEDLLEY